MSPSEVLGSVTMVIGGFPLRSKSFDTLLTSVAIFVAPRLKATLFPEKSSNDWYLEISGFLTRIPVPTLR